jgi:pimeloyl-ACP methyl ester carboxylesterase
MGNSAYAGWDFARNDIECAAYGGKAYPNEKINRTPVIFVHGNGDIGFGRGLEDGHLPDQTGLRELAKYLGAQGYTKAELYTTTWGPGSMALAALNNHKKEYVLQMRNFVEAVLAYTGASQVNIIGHSMGVTLGRKIVKGGKARDHVEGTYNVGDSLKSRVKTFIGIAGGNLGVATCRGAEGLPTCNRIDGFDPGLTIISGPSEFLTDLNNGGGTEGSNIYSIWSKYDEVNH